MFKQKEVIGFFTMKIPTIDDFTPCISWTQLENTLGKREYKRFQKWMLGQTCLEEGVYVHDLALYLEQRQKGIKEPEVVDW